MRALAIAAGLFVVLSVAGCNKTSGSETAAPTTLADAQLWDPCSLSDSAVKAAGVNPSSKDTNAFGAPQAGWKGCVWRNDTYVLSVYSTSHTIDEVRSNTNFKNIHDVDVSGRQALSYTEQGEDCGVDFPTSKGVVEIIARKLGTAATPVDECAVALSSANSLNSSIPK
ncbi:DUF3558 domain-containing protein [Nocardia macrotermitis]|uniref:DUF3558 domain-containing protein n=1 Tax=Nocardia macrotermitis TaxID=2585198 RepID=UPI001885B242